MSAKEILKLSWIKFIVIIILLIVIYYIILHSTPIGPTLPIHWYILVALFIIILIYLFVSIIATIYLKVKSNP
jgi:hypothetical protein